MCRTRLSAVTLFLAFAFFGAGCRQVPEKPVDTSRYPAFAAGEEAYLRGEYDSAVISFTRFLDAEGERNPLSARAHFWIAKCYLSSARYDLADKHFSRAAKSHDPWVASAGYEGLGDVARAAGDTKAARESYDRALAVGGGAADVGTLNFKLGLAERMTGRWHNAREYFLKAVAFEDSPYAARAAREASYPEDCFRVQIGSFTSRSAAEARLDGAAGRGYTGVVREANAPDAPDGPVYRVLVGEYKSHKGAAGALAALSLYYKDAFIVP